MRRLIHVPARHAMTVAVVLSLPWVVCGCGGFSTSPKPALNPYRGVWTTRVGVRVFTLDVERSGEATVWLDKQAGSAFVSMGGAVSGDATGTVGPVNASGLPCDLTFAGVHVEGTLSQSPGN